MRVSEIIRRFFGAQHNAETSRKFAEWFANPIDGAEKERVMRELWEQMPLREGDAEARERSWGIVRRRIADRQRTGRRRRLLRVAAAVAAMLLPSVAAVNVWTSQNRTRQAVMAALPELVEMSVPYGEIREVVLPDSTKVVLGGGTSIIYPERFYGSNREVYLSGRALFRVTRDTEHPFIVKTSTLRTEVLGTTFCVDSYADDTHSCVTLCEGRVRVCGNGLADEGYVLARGEQLRYDRRHGSYYLTDVPVDDISAWENGELVFRRQNLHCIIREIERRYGVNVYMASGTHEKARLTLRIPSDFSCSEAFELIQKLIPELRYRVDSDGRNIYLD